MESVDREIRPLECRGQPDVGFSKRLLGRVFMGTTWKVLHDPTHLHSDPNEWTTICALATRPPLTIDSSQLEELFLCQTDS